MEFLGLLKGKVKVYKSGLHSITKLFEKQDFASSCSENSSYFTLNQNHSPFISKESENLTEFNVLTSLLAISSSLPLNSK